MTKIYGTPPFTIEQKQDITSESLVTSGVFSIKNKLTSVDIKINYGPNIGFDFLYKFTSNFYFLLGGLYRKIEINGNSEMGLLADMDSIIKIKDLDIQTTAFPKISGKIEHLSLKIGGDWRKNFFKNKVYISLSASALLALYKKDEYDSQILLKTDLLVKGTNLTEIFKKQIKTKENSVANDIKDKFSLWSSSIVPLIAFSFGYYIN